MQDMKCIACLSTSNVKLYHSLSSSFPGFLNTPTSVLGVIQVVTNKKIKIAEDWPSEICTDCLKSLKDAYSFITQLLTSYAFLKRNYPNPNGENLIDTVFIKNDFNEPKVILTMDPPEETEDPLWIQSSPNNDKSKSKREINDVYKDTKKQYNLEQKKQDINKKYKLATNNENKYILEIDPSSTDVLIPLCTDNFAPKIKSNKRINTKKKITVPVEVKKVPDIKLEHNYTRSPDYIPQAFELYSDEELSMPNSPEKNHEIEQIMIKSELPLNEENKSFSEIKKVTEECIQSELAKKLKLVTSPKKSENGIVIMSADDVLKTRKRKKKNNSLGTSLEEKSKTKQINLVTKKIENQNLLEKEQIYKCELCPEKFATSKGLSIHLQYSHKEYDPLEVLVTKKIENQNLLEKEQIYKCELCPEKFATSKGLSIHLLYSHKEYDPLKVPVKKEIEIQNLSETRSVSKCDLCPQKFETSKGLYSDSKEYMKRKPKCNQKEQIDKCNLCPKKFKTSKGLSIHLQYSHNKKYMDRKLTCGDCNMTCRTESALYHHKNKFHPKKFYKCDECDKEFPTNYGRTLHRRTVHIGLPDRYMCNECGKMFKYSSSLQYHLFSTHNQSERKYLCKYCGHKAITIGNLMCHEATHTDERPFKCKLCPKTYRRKVELFNHNKSVHENKSLHKCKFCGKGFKKIWSMKVHWLQHKGQHKCKLCPRSFLDDENLKFHYKYHHKLTSSLPKVRKVFELMHE